MTFKLVGLGELLWDVDGAQARPGGAPGNFTVHAAQLGADAALVSRVGIDAPGDEIIAVLAGYMVNTDAVERDSTAPTGRVDVDTSSGQPVYTIHEGVAWDRLAGSDAGCRLVTEANAVCYGTLAQRAEPSRTTIRKLLTAVQPGCLRVFDVNLRQHYHSRDVLDESFATIADVVKVNDEELSRLAKWFSLPGGEREQMAELVRRYHLTAVACTRGERGSVILMGDTWSEQPGVPTVVADTIGAGDSFTAAMVLGLLAGWPLDDVNSRAVAVAGFVCSQPGGMPRLPERLREPFLKLR